MKSSVLLTVLTGLARISSATAATTDSVPNLPVTSLLTNLTTSAAGVLQLGLDGVLRSYAPDLKTIIDFAPLDPTQISELVSQARTNTHLTNLIPDFTGVNGHDVPIKQLAEPPKAITDAVLAAAELDVSKAVSVVNPLVEKRDCGNVICRNNGVCRTNSCVWCILFMPGIGACI
ncbi:hypothetical protein QBC44DRAFT_385923 [Cladorrhinum sp. PSN332]|nr:hypothetical protein QBC44DRAFT_385923 [Cladorrhinum sp. PSN332]